VKHRVLSPAKIPRLLVCHAKDFETHLVYQLVSRNRIGPNLRDMLLMKSDFILFAVSASSRLISTITELVNAER
jgi:hypothetical protein